MELTYLDNAATSWPKAPGVEEAVRKALAAPGNAGRGSHAPARAAGTMLENTRAELAALLGAGAPERIVFTLNATHALNLAIRGSLRPGDHVVTSSLEHNSVLRPLRAMRERGVELTILPADPAGGITAGQVAQALRPHTRLLAFTHASNVTGVILPVEEIATLARQRGLLFLLDASQTAGHLPLHLEQLGADMVAMSGHKGLLGPAGTGLLYLAPGVLPAPLLEGGTGLRAREERQPADLPDRYEAGTPNLPGLAGLGAAARFLREHGVERVREHEATLVARLLAGLAELRGVQVWGPPAGVPRAPVVAVSFAGITAGEVAFLLDRHYHVAAREGLHCAPLVFPDEDTGPGRGTLRFSFSLFNNEQQIEYVLAALRAILQERG